MEDLDALLEEHQLGNLCPPRWLEAALLGMESARNLRHWFEDGTPGYTSEIALRDTMATFTDASLLPSEVVSVGVPGRGITVARLRGGCGAQALSRGGTQASLVEACSASLSVQGDRSPRSVERENTVWPVTRRSF